MSIEGQGHFFTIYFPGFVCFVLYLAKISGERLQDHWSSGCKCAKIQTEGFYYGVILPNGANGNANSENPDQTAPLGSAIIT